MEQQIYFEHVRMYSERQGDVMNRGNDEGGRGNLCGRSLGFVGEKKFKIQRRR